MNIKNPSGDACNSAPASSTSCEIKASDVDSDKSGFQFVQAASQNPFVVTQAATRDTIGTNLLGDDAYNIFTTVKFVSTNSVTLNYESPNNIFDVIIYAQDGSGDRTANDCTVTIILIDANDKPYLTLPDNCDGKLCVKIDENNNEGSGSDRIINLLTYTQDEDTKTKWKCCADTTPFQILQPSNSESSNPCDLSKFEATVTGFKALAETLNFEAVGNDSCDIVVRITDKGTNGEAQVSENQLVHVKVLNVNDPPQNVMLTPTLCEVEENTMLGQQLQVNFTNFCQLTASDEDDTILSYLKSSPSETTGEEGHFFSTVLGNTNAEKWATLNYFNVETNGRFTVAAVPDFEIAKNLTFNVFSRDDSGRTSLKTTITIKIKDVNEAPIIDASLQPNGNQDNVCEAKFTTKEYKKNGGTVVTSQTLAALYDSADSGLPTLNFLANDPDQGAENTDWNTVTYSLKPGYFDSDLFKIDVTLGTITPKSNNELGSIDFETLSGRPGVGDGEMRINVIASDAGGEATDCDIYVTVVDVNEPPVINHLDGNAGESKGSPFVFDCTGVKVGDTVGSKIPAEDPDTAANDIAVCRLATLEVSGNNTDDDRELFDITEQCQIVVKQLSAGGKNLVSSDDTSFFKLYIEAFDQQNTSAARMYHINGNTGKFYKRVSLCCCCCCWWWWWW